MINKAASQSPKVGMYDVFKQSILMVAKKPSLLILFAALSTIQTYIPAEHIVLFICVSMTARVYYKQDGHSHASTAAIVKGQLPMLAANLLGVLFALGLFESIIVLRDSGVFTLDLHRPPLILTPLSSIFSGFIAITMAMQYKLNMFSYTKGVARNTFGWVKTVSSFTRVDIAVVCKLVLISAGYSLIQIITAGVTNIIATDHTAFWITLFLFRAVSISFLSTYICLVVFACKIPEMEK